MADPDTMSSSEEEDRDRAFARKDFELQKSIGREERNIERHGLHTPLGEDLKDTARQMAAYDKRKLRRPQTRLRPRLDERDVRGRHGWQRV